MLLPDLDPLTIELGGEEDDEDVARVLVELRSLVLVADVFQREWMEFEGLLEQSVVGVVGILDVEPNPCLPSSGQAAMDSA